MIELIYILCNKEEWSIMLSVNILLTISILLILVNLLVAYIDSTKINIINERRLNIMKSKKSKKDSIYQTRLK